MSQNHSVFEEILYKEKIAVFDRIIELVSDLDIKAPHARPKDVVRGLTDKREYLLSGFKAKAILTGETP